MPIRTLDINIIGESEGCIVAAAAVGPGGEGRGREGGRLRGDINWEEEKEESSSKPQHTKHHSNYRTLFRSPIGSI